jgi:hypothetical protein
MAWKWRTPCWKTKRFRLTSALRRVPPAKARCPHVVGFFFSDMYFCLVPYSISGIHRTLPNVHYLFSHLQIREPSGGLRSRKNGR